MTIEQLAEECAKYPTSMTVTKLWGGPWYIELDGGGKRHGRTQIEVAANSVKDVVKAARESMLRVWGPAHEEASHR